MNPSGYVSRLPDRMRLSLCLSVSLFVLMSVFCMYYFVCLHGDVCVSLTIMLLQWTVCCMLLEYRAAPYIAYVYCMCLSTRVLSVGGQCIESIDCPVTSSLPTICIEVISDCALPQVNTLSKLFNITGVALTLCSVIVLWCRDSKLSGLNTEC